MNKDDTAPQQQATNLQLMRQQMGQDAQPLVKAGFDSNHGFSLIARMSKALASSSMVPSQYQGNEANCIIALELANRIGASPLMVMQNLVIVHGKPTWSAQFLIATVNNCGRFSALRYEFFGERNADTWGCRAWAVEKATGERLDGADVTIGIAKKEGWYNKNGSKWQSIPQQMLMYRAASWWARAYAPELSMGLHTEDEIKDTFDAIQGADGKFAVTLKDLPSGEPPSTVTLTPAGEAAAGTLVPADLVDGVLVPLKDKTEEPPKPAKPTRKEKEATVAPAGGPPVSFDDVRSLVAKGEYSAARDIARSLTAEDRIETENLITARTRRMVEESQPPR